MGKQKDLNVDDIICQLCDDGFAQKDIVKILKGIASQSRVSECFRYYNQYFIRILNELTDEKKSKIIELYTNGNKNLYSIASSIGLEKCEVVVSLFLLRNGYKKITLSKNTIGAITKNGIDSGIDAVNVLRNVESKEDNVANNPVRAMKTSKNFIGVNGKMYLTLSIIVPADKKNALTDIILDSTILIAAIDDNLEMKRVGESQIKIDFDILLGDSLAIEAFKEFLDTIAATGIPITRVNDETNKVLTLDDYRQKEGTI